VERESMNQLLHSGLPAEEVLSHILPKWQHTRVGTGRTEDAGRDLLQIIREAPEIGWREISNQALITSHLEKELSLVLIQAQDIS
jgi:hypothetical protein